MDNTTLLVCPRCDSIKPLVAGSTRAICHKCSCSVWIAPSGRKIVKRIEALVTCLPCAIEMAKQDEEGAVIMPLTKEQIAERLARFQSPN